jgi:ribosomal protein S18 acetylase RimI-like enzyme
MTKSQLDNFLPNARQRPLEPTIRRASPDDLPQLTDLLSRSFYNRSGWLAWAYPLVKLGIQEDLKQRLQAQKTNYMCLTAIDTAPHLTSADWQVEGQPGSTQSEMVAGTLELSERQSWPWQALSPKYIYLSNLAVRPDLRRRGIALALLAHAERLALTWDFKDLYLHVMEDNVQARGLYRKAGFRLCQTEETPYSWLGLQAKRLLLHKSLVA